MRQTHRVVIGLLSAALAGAVLAAPARADERERPAHELVGLASWYGQGHHGLTTSSGERFDMHALTAAHPTLPFGSHVRVTSVSTGRSVVVRIIDRGPHLAGRVIDVSLAAGRLLGIVHRGVARVRLEVLNPDALRRKLPGALAARPPAPDAFLPAPP